MTINLVLYLKNRSKCRTYLGDVFAWFEISVPDVSGRSIEQFRCFRQLTVDVCQRSMRSFALHIVDLRWFSAVFSCSSLDWLAANASWQ